MRPFREGEADALRYKDTDRYAELIQNTWKKAFRLDAWERGEGKARTDFVLEPWRSGLGEIKRERAKS